MYIQNTFGGKNLVDEEVTLTHHILSHLVATIYLQKSLEPWKPWMFFAIKDTAAGVPASKTPETS